MKNLYIILMLGAALYSCYRLLFLRKHKIEIALASFFLFSGLKELWDVKSAFIFALSFAALSCLYSFWPKKAKQ